MDVTGTVSGLHDTKQKYEEPPNRTTKDGANSVTDPLRGFDLSGPVSGQLLNVQRKKSSRLLIPQYIDCELHNNARAMLNEPYKLQCQQREQGQEYTSWWLVWDIKDNFMFNLLIYMEMKFETQLY